MWIQLLSGVVPIDNQTITGNGGATADVNVNVESYVVPSTFIGVSTGTAIIGAPGLGIEADDATNADLLTDLEGNINQPPNNVLFTLQNLMVGDRVLIGPRSGSGNLEVDQLSLATSLTTANVTSVEVTTAIPTDTPKIGTIRVQTDSGKFIRVEYTAFSGTTFTTASTDFSGDNATSGNNVFISYIDDIVTAGTTLTFTSIFNTPRSLFIRVRNSSALIKTFETTGTLGSGGGSSTTSRISDV